MPIHRIRGWSLGLTVVLISLLVLGKQSRSLAQETATPRVTRTRLHNLGSAFATYGAGGRVLAIGEHGGGITVWDERAERSPMQIGPGSFWGFNFVLTGDGSRLYLPSSGGNLGCRTLKDGNPVTTGLERPARCKAVALDRKDKILATGRVNGIDLWDRETGLHLRSLEGHPACEVSSLAFSPDGHFLLSSASPPPDDPTRERVILWRVADGAKLHELVGDAGTVEFASNTEFVSHNEAGVVLRSVSTGRVTWTREGNRARAVSVSPESGRMVVGTESGTVEVWDLTRRQRLHNLAGSDSRIVATAIDPSGLRVACIDTGEQVIQWTLSR